jgi:hypothetical protein
VHRHHAAVRVWVASLIHNVHEQLFWSHSERNHECHITVVWVEPILSWPKGVGCRNLDCFVPSASDLEVALVLLVESYRFVID